jgi:predicted molibdopterin-dependent oxidoreductase YjgC
VLFSILEIEVHLPYVGVSEAAQFEINSHPVLATRIKRAHKLHGQKMIVSDLRRK